MLKSAFALLALVSLALFASVVNFVLGIFEIIGSLIGVIDTIEAAQFRAVRDIVFCSPFTVIAVLSHLVSGDVAYLVSIIETGYGSIRWRYTGSVKHFPQYEVVRLEQCPGFLTRLAASASTATVNVRLQST